MDADAESTSDAQSFPVTVGIVATDRSRADQLQSVILELGWELTLLDPSATTVTQSDRVNLLVFSLAHVSPGDLETIVSVGIQSRATVLVIADDRNPQVIADVLRSGADDYLVSPFAPAELSARMRGLVTRVWPSADRRSGGRIEFDARKRSIRTGPYAVAFTPMEWDVLSILLEQDGMPISAEAIVNDLHLRDVQVSTIPTIISRIRRKLAVKGFQAIAVATVQNRGYLAQFRRSTDQPATLAGSDRPTGIDGKCQTAQSRRAGGRYQLESAG